MIFKENGTYHIAWQGVGNPASGYGSSNLNVVKALRAAGVHVHDPGTSGYENCNVGVLYASAGRGDLERLPSPYRILFTMFEADRWPREWVNTANCVNQVWVPSGFCRDALAASGCESPIEVVPLGVDTGLYSAYRRSAPEGTYTFGFAGAASYRKGFHLLVEAFRTEFADGEDVRLAIRSANMFESDVPKGDPRILVNRGATSEEAMRVFYRSVDCFVMPSHGEGFGLTPLEAMACGCCVAMTNWGGCTEYMGEHALSIAIDGLESCAGYHNCGGNWAKPCLASLRYCMRWAYENRKAAAKMGRQAARHVKERWSYQRSAEVIRGLLDEVEPSQRVEVEARQVVVWHGNPRNVTTAVGGFTRGIPRELTEAQIARLNPSDLGPHGFATERRYRRVSGSV